jgi:HSP20 family molecular chaperone IbpA
MITFSGITPKTIVDIGSARSTVALKPRSWTPVADVYEMEDQLVIEVELPGSRNDTFATKITHDRVAVPHSEHATTYVIVEGRRDIVPNTSRRFHNERWQGDFARLFVIPPEYDASRADLAYDDGLLRIRIPKRPSSAVTTTILDHNQIQNNKKPVSKLKR